MRIRHQAFWLILSIILFNLLIVVALVVAQYTGYEESEFQSRKVLLEKALMVQYEQYGRDMSQAMGEAIINPMFLTEYAEVDRLLESLRTHGDVVGVYAYDKDFKIISEGNEDSPIRGESISAHLGMEVGDTPAEVTRGTIMYVVQPIRINEQFFVGGLVLVLDMSIVRKSLQDIDEGMAALRDESTSAQVRFFVFAAPVMVGLALLISLFAAGGIVRPINQISTEVGKLKNLEYDLNLPTQRKDEIGDLSRNLEKFAAILKENNRFKDNVISSISHELRTPLTSVRGFATIIRRDLDKVHSACTQDDDHPIDKKINRIRNNLMIIEQEGERLTRLTDNVLDLKLIESGKMVWHPKPTSLEDMLSRVAETMQGMFALHKEVTLETDIPAGLPDAMVDPDRIEQVAINLLSNAIKYTETGVVSITVQDESDTMLRVDVRDTGVGIPENMAKYIFERFQQVSDNGNQQSRGSGLGLAISKEIVEQHGGRIWFKPNPDQGSCFSFTLPKYIET